MAAIRALLTRVTRLEQARVPGCSPFVSAFGSFEAFAAKCEAGITAGIYDPLDMPCVLASIHRWICEEQ